MPYSSIHFFQHSNYIVQEAQALLCACFVRLELIPHLQVSYSCRLESSTLIDFDAGVLVDLFVSVASVSDLCIRPATPANLSKV